MYISCWLKQNIKKYIVTKNKFLLDKLFYIVFFWYTIAKMNGNQQNQQLKDMGTVVESSTQETAMASDDADLFDIKQRVKGMDEEAARLLQLQTEMEQQIMKSTNSPTASNWIVYDLISLNFLVRLFLWEDSKRSFRRLEIFLVLFVNNYELKTIRVVFDFQSNIPEDPACSNACNFELS